MRHKQKARRKNLLSTSTLSLNNVDILEYDFSLTKTGHLRHTIIKIIKEKIPNVALNTTQRRTRSIYHTHGEVGLQFNEDNALVANDDEDETSQSSSSSSNGSENDGIDLGSDSCDTQICINIGGSHLVHFVHSFVSLACLLFRHFWKGHAKIQNKLDHFFKTFMHAAPLLCLFLLTILKMLVHLHK